MQMHNLGAHPRRADERRLSSGLLKLQGGMSSAELHSLGRARRGSPGFLSVRESGDCLFLVVQHIEHRHQLGDLKNVLDLGR
jgi:hypothetical protein